MISRFLTTTHTRKTAFSWPSTKFHALQRTVKPGWGLRVKRDEIKGGNASSSRHGGKTIPAQDENRKRQRGSNEKGGEGGGSEPQRAKEGGRGCAHTPTQKETQRLDSIEISMFRSITGRNHSELSSTTI